MELFVLTLTGIELALIIGMIIVLIATTGKQRTWALTIIFAILPVIHFMMKVATGEMVKFSSIAPIVIWLGCALYGAIKLRLENKTEEKASA